MRPERHTRWNSTFTTVVRSAILSDMNGTGNHVRWQERVAGRRILTAAVLCLAGAASGTAERYVPKPFEYYQPILDRMPFGAAPAQTGAGAQDAESAKSAAQEKIEQERLAKQVNMSAVNITPEGRTAIGFTDLSQKPPVNHYLLVGDEADGWKVLEADYDLETATIEKEGVAITLKLGQGLQPPAAAVAGAPAAGARKTGEVPVASVLPPGLTRRVRRPVAGTVAGAGGGPASGTAPVTKPPPSSYVERNRERALQREKEEQASREKMQAQLAELARKAALNEMRRRDQEEAEARAAEQAEEAAAAQQEEEQSAL